MITIQTGDDLLDILCQLAESDLPIAEIGVAAVFLAATLDSETNKFLMARLATDEFMPAAKSLRDRGLLEIGVAGKSVRFSLNLEGLADPQTNENSAAESEDHTG